MLHFRKPEARTAIDIDARRFPPVPVFEIPLHRVRDPLFKGLAGLPAEFAMRFRRIDRVTEIVPRSILHELNERSHLGPSRDHPLEDVANEFNDIEVAALAVAAEIVFISRLA